MDIVAENYEVARVPKGKAVVEEAGRGGPSLASTTPVVDALSFTQPSLLHSLRPASTPLNPAVPDKFRSLSSGIVVTPPATITGPSRTDDSGSAATSVALDGPSAVPGSTFVSTSSVPVSPSAPISSTSLPCDDALGLVVVLEPPQPQSQSSSKPWASSVAGPGDAATAEVSPKRETFLSPSITSNHRGPVISSPAPVLGAPASIDGTSAAAMPDPQVIEDGIKSNVAEPILPSSSLAPKVEPQAPIVSSPSSQRELQSSPPLQSSEMPSAQTVALPSSFTTNAQSCSPIDTLEQNFKHRYRSLVSYSTITADTITTTTTTVSRSTTSPPPFPASSAIVPVSLASGASESSDVADDRHLSAPSSSSPPVLKTETETEMLINSRSTGLPSSVTLENDDDAYDHHPLPASSLHSALSSPPPSSNSTGHALERSSRDISTSFPSASVAVTAASGDLPPSGALESLGTANCNPSIGSGTEHSATENATAAAARNTMITTQCNDDSYPATSLRNVSPSASTEPTVEVNANLVQNVDSGPPIAPPPEVLSRKPVVGGERGEGWPYGPEGWPQKDDKWPWKVGKRMHTNGYFKDRFLGLPKSLHKGKKITEFASKKSIVEYLRQTFPDLNVENFFKSFTWRVPCARVRNPAATVSKDNSIGLKRPRSEDEEDEDQEVEGGHFSKRPRECKAGNPNCGLVTGLSLLLRDGVGSLPCDICCTEGGFCRECKCILCCKIIAPAEENFVRCLHRPTAEPGLCGHAAHLQCAVHTKMAGVVKKKNLDMEYLCRRCDSKTDLRETVTLLLEAFGNIEQKSRAEMSLELTLELMRGTERGGSGAKVLESLVQSALKKVQDGADINGVYRELKDQGAAADAARHNQNVVRTPSNVEDVSFVEDSSVSFSPAARHNQNLARTSSNVEDLTQQPEASLDQWLQEGSPSSHPSPGTPSSFTSRLKSTPSVTSGHRNISPDVVESKGGGCGVVKHSPPGIDHSNASPEVETNSNYASNKSGGKAFARNRQKSSHIVRVGSSSLYSDLKAVSDKRMAKGSKGAAGGSVSEDEANVSQLVERGSTFTPRKQKGQSSSGRDCGVGEVCRACGGSGSMPPQGTIPSRGEHEPGPSDNSNNKKKRRVEGRVEGGRDANVNAISHGKDDADHGASTAHAEHDANITDAAPQIDEDSIRNTHFEASQDVNLGVRHTVNAQDNNCGECHENNADDRLGVSMVDNHDENARDDHHSNMSNHHDKNSCDGSRHVNVAERDAVMVDGDPGDDNNTDIRHGRGADYDFEVLPRRDNVFGLSLDLMADEYDQHTEAALRYLKQAQDEEFELVKERLVAQKASILENYRLLEIARVRFSDQPEIISVPGLQAFDDLLMNVAEQYTKTMKEKQKFRKMLDVAGGFGLASTNLRRKFYDTQAAD